MFGTKQAIAAGEALIRLRDDYSNPPETERGLDPLLYAHLCASFPRAKVSRQHCIYFPTSSHPSRIDFRVGSSNPAVIEFAVRSTYGMQQLQGPQNKSELTKLSKVPPSEAKRRILLLVDLKSKALLKEKLKATYDPLHVGQGRKERHPVTVVYVHRDVSFSFAWSPYKEL